MSAKLGHMHDRVSILNALPARRVLRLCGKMLRIGLTVAALVWIATYFVRNYAAISAGVADLESASIMLAMLFVIIGLFPGAWAWQRLLASQVPTLTLIRGSLVYLQSSIGKYTPGGVLAFAMQHRQLEQENVGLAVLVRVFIGTALAACVAAALLGLPAALTLIGHGASSGWIFVICALIVLFLGYACWIGRWPILSDVCARPNMPGPVLFTTTILLMAVAWSLTGMHLAVLGMGTDAGFVFLLSAYAFSAIAGIVFAVLPGAFGVRDGVLILILAARLDPTDAIILALLSRTMIVAGDVIATALASLFLTQIEANPQIERASS